MEESWKEADNNSKVPNFGESIEMCSAKIGWNCSRNASETEVSVYKRHELNYNVNYNRLQLQN